MPALEPLSSHNSVGPHAKKSKICGADSGISGEKIALHRIALLAILPRRPAGDFGYRQCTSIEEVGHDKHAELALLWFEAAECLCPDMRKGARGKSDAYAP